ncbi:hypothetical protein [Adhaeribacter aquaticus]|uniref:hypothetical protein n=1 Tax=Adhaeribacter aquaticus TaxID=299567 RepID=UPI0004149863|nr:hypothetical protein [Adhaeribacter aquaticus]
MEINLYEIASGIFILTVASVLLLLLTGVAQGLKGEGNQKELAGKIFIGLIGWLILLGVLAVNGFFQNFTVLPPRFLISNLPPLALAIGLLFSGRFSRFLTKISTARIIGLQTFRGPVEIVLWLLFLNNTVPIQMSFEGRNFDVLVGLTAPFVAYYVGKKKAGYQQVGVVWNILGLGLVLNIVGIAILSAPSPFRVFMNEPANTFIATLPFIWLPGFLVPVAIALHLFSLKQLLQNKSIQHRSQMLQPTT